jgi:hypothetical protein
VNRGVDEARTYPGPTTGSSYSSGSSFGGNSGTSSGGFGTTGGSDFGRS